jgi:Fur family transcriptional regulator, ferric uptake regulator
LVQNRRHAAKLRGGWDFHRYVTIARVSESPKVPRIVVADAREAIATLRGRGLRLSTARRLVVEALFAADGPASAVHLARDLRLDESSVYRNLEVLEQHGLVHHLHLGHSPGLYVISGREDSEYLYCPDCARVTAVPPAELDPIREQIRARFGYTAEFTHFAIVGRCAACSEGGPQDDATDTGSPIGVAHSHGNYIHAHGGAGGGRHRH